VNKHWQCTRVDYHVMVRPVTRCTLCGATVEEKVVPYDLHEKNFNDIDIELLLWEID